MDIVWDIDKVERDLNDAFKSNSERDLLKVLKHNVFLFYEIYRRKLSICPCFAEVSLGDKLRCDFCWLNDNSDGPEWTLVEIEKPNMKLFTSKNDPTAELTHSIEQVTSWKRYFDENPSEKKRIFGAVARFRYVLIGGNKESWSEEFAAKWRINKNNDSNIEIRTSDVFYRSLLQFKKKPNDFWSFAEHPKCVPFSKLEEFWKSYEYMDFWRKMC